MFSGKKRNAGKYGFGGRRRSDLKSLNWSTHQKVDTGHKVHLLNPVFAKAFQLS
jgi:hypothetical protein